MKVLALPARVLSLGTYVVVKPIEAVKAFITRSRWMNAAAGPKNGAKAGNKDEGARDRGTTEGRRKAK